MKWSIPSTCGALCEICGVIWHVLGELCNSSQSHHLHKTCVHNTSPRPLLEYICEIPLQEKSFCSFNQAKQSNFASKITLEPFLERIEKSNSCKKCTKHLKNIWEACTTKIVALWIKKVNRAIHPNSHQRHHFYATFIHSIVQALYTIPSKCCIICTPKK